MSTVEARLTSMPGVTLSGFIRANTGVTAKEFADSIGRNRGTIRNWWRNKDPILWLAVAGYKAANHQGQPMPVFAGNTATGPVVVDGSLLNQFGGTALEAAETLSFMSTHLEGRMGDAALGQFQVLANQLVTEYNELYGINEEEE